MKSWFTPTTIKGQLVELHPLHKSHKEAMIQAASDGDLWNLWYTSVPSPDTVDDFIDAAVQQYESHQSIPFAIIDKKENRLVGTTRYMNIEVPHKRLEIGHTWYAQSVQRTGINTECKYLLLQHAFETLDTVAVEFRTHFHNHRSRNAILRLGAKQDGILRNHRLDAEGNLRDTVVFSILKSEWQTVKKGLEFKMSQKY